MELEDVFDIRIEKQMDFHMSKKTWGGKIHYSAAVICRYMTYETATYIKCICQEPCSAQQIYACILCYDIRNRE